MASASMIIIVPRGILQWDTKARSLFQLVAPLVDVLDTDFDRLVNVNG